MIIAGSQSPPDRLEAIYECLRELRRDLYASHYYRLGHRSQTALSDCRRMLDDIEANFVIPQEELEGVADG